MSITFNYFDDSKTQETFANNKKEMYKQKKNKASQDLCLVLIISMFTLLLSVYFDFYEFLFHWSRKYDGLEVDELIITTLIFFPSLVWFSFRRWKDASLALKKSLKAQLELEKSEEQKTEMLNENRRLLNRVSEIQEEERKSIASDLHDIFGQHLTAIHANASTIQSGMDKVNPAFEIVNKIISSSHQLSRLTRLMLNELRPALLENIGLDVALNNLVSEWKENNPIHNVEFSSTGSDKNLDISIALSLYRSVQEGLTNISKHSKSDDVSLFLDYQSLGFDERDNWVFMLLSDNGCGFSLSSNGHGLGLIGIRERINNLGGSFEIITEIDKGTDVSILIPKDLIS